MKFHSVCGPESDQIVPSGQHKPACILSYSLNINMISKKFAFVVLEIEIKKINVIYPVLPLHDL